MITLPGVPVTPKSVLPSSVELVMLVAYFPLLKQVVNAASGAHNDLANAITAVSDVSVRSNTCAIYS